MPPKGRGRGRGSYEASGSQQDRQQGGQRGNPRGRGYGPPRGRQERGSHSRQEEREPYPRQEREPYSRQEREPHSRQEPWEGQSGRRGHGPPRPDRGGYRRPDDRQQSSSSSVWNPFPAAETASGREDIEFDAEDFALNYKLTVSPSPLPRNPGMGKLGQKIKLISNCFTLKAPSGFVYHYDVDIFNAGGRSTATGPETAPSSKFRCLSTKRNREVVKQMLRSDDIFSGSYAAYDGKKNLFSRRALDITGEVYSCKVVLTDASDKHPNEFVVFVKPVIKADSNDNSINLDTLHALYSGIINTPPLDAIMAIETILRHGPTMRFTPVGRNFFYPPNPSDLHPLGGGVEIWFGYHQSVRLGQWKPMINLDVSATAFYEKREMLAVVADILHTTVEGLHQVAYFRDFDIRNISKKLTNLQVETTHLKSYRRKYRVLKLTKQPANKLEFTLKENGREIKKTVARYFEENHNLKLRFPHLPCIQALPVTKNVYLPIEICDLVAGQSFRKKLDEKQTAEMIKFTAVPPNKRFREIKDIREKTNYNQDETLRGFGMNVNREPLQMEGRILNVPGVLYKDGAGEKKITPYNGSWDMRGTKYFRGAEIKSWVLISFANPRFCNEGSLERFAEMLCSIASGEGISISRPASVEIADSRRKPVEEILRTAKRKFSADLAIVVIPGGSKVVYNEVKQAAETVLGLVTQCITDKNLTRNCKPQVVSNLCQKINAKMGGVNNSLISGELPAVMRRPVMLIGADVTHPSPSGDDDLQVSIAAVVGSLDKHPSRYAVTVRAQKNRNENKEAIEIIVDLENMVMELLTAFHAHTPQLKPERIIFYRDGVSEGQFAAVQAHEVECIRKACRRLQAGYEPGITFIVVQKRHHMRFMPQDERQGVGRMKNVPPGTTVDTVVTHPLNFDFFLCSHVGIQGTSRPCHYTVIHDDNSFTADDLQKLTFYLCHTYARCTRSISCPTPVQYAHLAAYRSRQYLSNSPESSVSSTTTSRSEVPPLSLEKVRQAIKVIDGLADTMYFV